MKNWIILLPLAALMACGTPQERCISRASAELRTVDSLISETEATLRRGYALKREPYTYTISVTCQTGTDAQGKPIYGTCPQQQTSYRNVPVAVDLAEERRKLAGLKQTRATEAKRVQAAAAQCRAQFPE